MNRRSFLSPLMALALIAPLGAQISVFGWIGDDGFDVGCCVPVNQVNLPSFWSTQMDGSYACILACDLEAEFDVVVTTQHIPFICDLALIPLTVFPAGVGAPGFSAMLIGKYSRTWVEMDPNGLGQNQIWRWLVNTNMIPTSGATPCPIPPDPVGTPMHFTGHIDYACTINATGGIQVRTALNLNHLPGCISHNALSASPLPVAAGHHERSYHLVAPDTFAFGPVGAPTGPTLQEAVRSTWLPPMPYTCLGEADVVDGLLDVGFSDCLCPTVTPTGPFLWDHERLEGFVECPAGTPPFPYMSFAVGPPAPPLPTGFVSLPIGAWIGADPFPGSRELRIYWGVLRYFDICNPNSIPIHIVTGVSTNSPNSPGFLFPDPLDPNPPTAPFPVFLDLEDMILPNGLIGPWTLGWSSYFLSQVVWNLNL